MFIHGVLMQAAYRLHTDCMQGVDVQMHGVDACISALTPTMTHCNAVESAALTCMQPACIPTVQRWA